MKKIHITFQESEQDCGPACLQMISQYYNIKTTLTELQEAACTDLFGTNGIGIIKAANSIGLIAHAYKSKEKKVDINLPLPTIVQIKKNTLNHYIVITKITKKKIFSLDPDSGFQKYSYSEFEKNWTGIFFTFEKQKNQEEKEQNILFKNFLIKTFSKFKKEFFVIFIASTLLYIFNIFIAFFFRFLIDNILYNELKLTLITLSIIYLFIILAQNFIDLYKNKILMLISNKIDFSLIENFSKNLLNLNFSFFSKRQSGELLTKFDDIYILRNGIFSIVSTFTIDLVLFTGSLIVLISISAKLFFIASLFVFFTVIISLILIKKYKQMIKKKAFLEAHNKSLINEILSSIENIKLLNIESFMLQKFKINTKSLLNKGIKIGETIQYQTLAQGIFLQLGNLAIYFFGSLSILNGSMSLGQLISFLTLLSLFIEPFSKLVSIQSSIQDSYEAYKRLNNILILKKETSGSSILNKINTIEFKNIFFSYGTRNLTLKNINFKIAQGQKVGFIGESGSGKTTILKLLTRLYAPTKGEILINNIPIEQYSLTELRNHISSVPQDTVLFNGSIYENILLDKKEHITEEQFYNICNKADINNFVEKLPNQYNTIVGERGLSLSGGERQKIAFARSFLKTNDLLLLDEATASLDTISENNIMTNIFNNKELSAIIIAHRLQTVIRCNYIYALKNGEIIEQGTPDDLIKKRGIFYNMINIQGIKNET